MEGKNNLWREICEWHVEILIFGPMIIAPIVIVLGLLFGVIPLVPEPHIVQGEVCGKMYIATFKLLCYVNTKSSLHKKGSCKNDRENG